jgi:hypothetical protein
MRSSMQLMPVMISLMGVMPVALIVAAILALPSAGALADHREIGHLRANSGAQPESSLDSRVFRRLPTAHTAAIWPCWPR